MIAGVALILAPSAGLVATAVCAWREGRKWAEPPTPRAARGEDIARVAPWGRPGGGGVGELSIPLDCDARGGRESVNVGVVASATTGTRLVPSFGAA